MSLQSREHVKPDSHSVTGKLHLWVRCFIFVLCVLVETTPAQAHEIKPTIAQLVVQTDNSITVSLKLSLESLLAGNGNLAAKTDSSDHGEQYQVLRAKTPAELNTELSGFLSTLLDGIQLRTDISRVELDFLSADIPTAPAEDIMRESTLAFKGKLPPQTKWLTWEWENSFGSIILRADDAAGTELLTAYLQSGQQSDAIPVSYTVAQTPLSIFKNYLIFGFVHIVPKGLDHILFVLALFLFSTQWRPLLIQVTVFTAAHSLTLALGITGLVTLPPMIVEPLIALSIAFIAVENILTTKLGTTRICTIFLFGLLHGLGFASVLADVGMSTSTFLTALLAFNIGVEIGQLCVLASAFFTVGLLFRNRSWYRNGICMPGSIALAAVGIYWFLLRVF